MRSPWVVTALLIVGACSAPSVTTMSPSSSPSTSVGISPATSPAASTVLPQSGALSAGELEAAAVDVDGYLRELEMVHPDPFHGITRELFVAQLETYKKSLADISPEQAMVEFMRINAHLSAEGRDGHQFAIPYEDAEGRVLPIRVYEFDDGLAVTDGLGAAPFSLVGQHLTEIGGHPIREILDLLEPLVPRDSAATVPGFRPFFLLRVDVLEGLGLVEDGPIELVGSDQQSVMVEPVSYETSVGWSGSFFELPFRDDLRYWDNRTDNLWTEFLADDQALYMRYAHVQPVDAAALDELIDRADDSDVEKVILDLRHNGGGNNFTYPPLLEALRHISVDRPGHLYVLTDRLTFSAASNLATEIEQTTDAIFVGEAMGGGLNFWNDVEFYPLPHLPIPMRAGISTIYWEKSTPDDPRLTIEPDVSVPVLSADFFEGRDPALEAVLDG